MAPWLTGLEVMIILYAEDDIDDFQFFTEMVSAMDSTCTCFNVSNGRELLDFLETTSMLPDLILLDINMPVMNGRACLKEIKRDPRLKHIPVVIFTTSKNEQDRQLCLELGATDFLLKPTTSNQATEQLKGLLSSIG